MPSMHTLTTPRRRALRPALWGAGAAPVLVAVAIAVGTSPLADAAPVAPAATAAPTTTPGGCVQAAQVWLVAVNGGQMVANRCVGRPATGLAALQAAGVDVQTDAKQRVCSMNGVPAGCAATPAPSPAQKTPTQVWKYFHLVAGGGWTASGQGPAAFQPRPGTVEGWCLAASATASCTPPGVDLTGPSQQIASGRPAASLTARPSTTATTASLPPAPVATAAASTTEAAPVATASTSEVGAVAAASSMTAGSGAPSASPSDWTSSEPSDDPSTDAAPASSSNPMAGPLAMVAVVGVLALGLLGHWAWRRRRRRY